MDIHVKPGLRSRMAAEHFVERGFRHFAWYSDYFTNVERLRLLGFCQRLASFRFSCHRLIWHHRRRRQWPDSWQNKRLWLGQQLRALPKPLAILAYSDYDAATVMETCAIAGLDVPDEVAILGINNSELYQIFSISGPYDLVFLRGATLSGRGDI